MLKESIVDFDPATGRVSHGPHLVYLESSSRCNLKCVHCATDFGLPENKGLDMSLEVVKKIRPWLENARFINLNGIGEPLLASNFDEILEYCSQGNGELSFNTNGMLLSPSRCERLVQAKVNSIAISVDGWETNEAVRGVPYETVRSRILNLGEAKRNSGKDRPILALAYTVMKRNYRELPRVLADLLPLGILQAVHVQPLIIFWEGLREENIYSTEPDLDDVIAECNTIAAENNVEFTLTRTTLAADERNAAQANSSDLGSASQKFGCIDPFFQMQVKSNGDIQVCCYGLTPPGLNVLKQDVDEIWNGEWYRELRRGLHSKEFPGTCGTCPLVHGGQTNQQDSIRDGMYHSQQARFA